MKKLRDIYKSKYLILQVMIFIQLCLLNLFVIIVFFIQVNDNRNRDTN
jgi:hypothetical protein